MPNIYTIWFFLIDSSLYLDLRHGARTGQWSWLDLMIRDHDKAGQAGFTLVLSLLKFVQMAPGRLAIEKAVSDS